MVIIQKQEWWLNKGIAGWMVIIQKPEWWLKKGIAIGYICICTNEQLK